jgi:Domain of unknown function (DUF397)
MHDDMRWRKSSYSGQGANCVEVAGTRDGAAVRDSKDPEGPGLRFTTVAWRAFLAGVKSGQI